MDGDKKIFAVKILRTYGIWLLAAVTLAAFLPAVTYGYIPFLDDNRYVFDNPNLQLSFEAVRKLIATPILGLFTPLQMASYLIDYAIAGLEPWIYHLHNILWHVLAVCLVWRFFREIGIARFTALCCAAAFAIHPQRVESVVWIAERKDVMATAFFVAAMCFFLYGRRHNKPISIAALCCMLAAMMSKPQALLLPPVLYLLEVHRTRRWLSMEHVKAVLPYCILSVIYGAVVKKMIQSSVESFAVGQKPLLFTVTHMIYNYLRFAGKTICPAGLIPLYPFLQFTRELIIFSFAGLFASLAVLAVIWKRNRELFLYDILPMLFCFGCILLPVSGIIVFSNTDFADRYSYIPSIFLLGCTGLVLDRIRWRRFHYSLPILAGYLAVLVFSLEMYMPSWKNNFSVLRAATAVDHPNFVSIIHLSCYYFDEKQPEKTIGTIQKFSLAPYAHQQIKEIILYYSELVKAVNELNAGTPGALQKLRRLASPEILEPMLAARYPGAVTTTLFPLAAAELHSGNIPGAIDIYTRLSKIRPDTFASNFYQGVADILRDDPVSAERNFLKAHRLKPEDAETVKNLELARKLIKNGKQKVTYQ